MGRYSTNLGSLYRLRFLMWHRILGSTSFRYHDRSSSESETSFTLNLSIHHHKTSVEDGRESSVIPCREGLKCKSLQTTIGFILINMVPLTVYDVWSRKKKKKNSRLNGRKWLTPAFGRKWLTPTFVTLLILGGPSSIIPYRWVLFLFFQKP